MAHKKAPLLEPVREEHLLPDAFISHINEFPIMTAYIERINGVNYYIYGLKPRSIGISQIPEHIANILHMTPELGIWFVKNSVHHKGKLFKIPFQELIEQVSLLGYDFDTPPEARYNMGKVYCTPRAVDTAHRSVRSGVKKQVTPKTKKATGSTKKNKTPKAKKKSTKKKKTVVTGKVRQQFRSPEDAMLREQERAAIIAREQRDGKAESDRATTQSIVERGAKEPSGKLGDALKTFGIGKNRKRYFTE